MVCPHCDGEITDQDLKKYDERENDAELFDQFCETETCKTYERKSKWCLFGAVITFLFCLFFVEVIGFVVNDKTAFHVITSDTTVVLLRVITGVICLIMFNAAFRYLGKRDKLFKKFKKSRTAQ